MRSADAQLTRPASQSVLSPYAFAEPTVKNVEKDIAEQIVQMTEGQYVHLLGESGLASILDAMENRPPGVSTVSSALTLHAASDVSLYRLRSRNKPAPHPSRWPSSWTSSRLSSARRSSSRRHASRCSLRRRCAPSCTQARCGGWRAHTRASRTRYGCRRARIRRG